MKTLIDLACFGDAKVWLLYGITPKQARGWIRRRFKTDVKELTEDFYSGITVSITALEWVVYIPPAENASPVDLLKAVVHEAAHVAQQLVRNNAISDEETLCLITDFLAGKMSGILGLV